MAGTHHKSGTDTPTAKSRRYTVEYIHDHLKHRPSPSITLHGHWMAELGFCDRAEGRGDLHAGADDYPAGGGLIM
ncbi:SymE family type I addiction module toxin [Pantoea dispersa]|uniref:SymE family type I addiction module toxin n=1 Tax=Pantoea dispersa TaxID=59814 RepID=UPI002DB83EAE|nr:SymE family type I addiction module toxin [Pantoea dispersa]